MAEIPAASRMSAAESWTSDIASTLSSARSTMPSGTIRANSLENGETTLR